MAVEEQQATGKYRLPDNGRAVDYATFRELTGKCENCNAPMKGHPVCDACGILCGTGHLDGPPSPYRGHTLCGHCIVNLKHLDRVLRREGAWEEFLSGKRIYSRRKKANYGL
ncbi:hypothetical protein ES708_28760 [subsurface metagenome]